MKKLMVLVVLVMSLMGTFTMSGFADTDTPTVTPTFTPTPSLFEVRVDGYAAWLADTTGDTNGAVVNYYKKATGCAGRLDYAGQARAVYSAGHALVKYFNSTSGYNSNVKRIRLILTPSTQATAGAAYADTLTTSYTYLIDDAENHLNYAKLLTGTTEVAATAVKNKIQIDVDRIAEIRDWITDNL